MGDRVLKPNELSPNENCPLFDDLYLPLARKRAVSLCVAIKFRYTTFGEKRTERKYDDGGNITYFLLCKKCPLRQCTKNKNNKLRRKDYKRSITRQLKIVEQNLRFPNQTNT